jgi:hypothetical protein
MNRGMKGNQLSKIPAILKVTLAISILLGLKALGTRAAEKVGVESAANVSVSTTPEVVGAPKCETAGTGKITITCSYTGTPRVPSDAKNSSRLVLNRAVVSLDPKEEGNLHLELTFTSQGEGRMFETRQAYLQIDDDRGRNYVRRVLTNVDFSKFAQGERRTFSEELLVAIFRSGHYIIRLWIPDPDPAKKFDAANAFLLSSVGVADPATGLNTLADFTVDARKPSR